MNNNKYLIKKLDTKPWLKYWLANKLPKEYKRLNYIENTSKSYINTLYLGNLETEIELCGLLHSGSGHIFGNIVNTERAISCNYNGVNRFGNVALSINMVGTGKINYEEKYIVKLNKDYLRVNGKAVLQYKCKTEFITDGYIYIFVSKQSNNYSFTRVFWCTIKEQGKLVRNFIPCEIKETGEKGLYDTVTQQFFRKLWNRRVFRGLKYGVDYR